MTWMTLVVVLALWCLLSLPVALMVCRSFVTTREARLETLVPSVTAMTMGRGAQ